MNIHEKIGPKTQKSMKISKNHCQEIMKIHKKVGPKTKKNIKMSKNDPRAEKVAPRIGKGAKKGQAYMRFGPLESA